MSRVRWSVRIVGGLGTFVAAILGVVAFIGFDAVWTDYRWYASLGRQSVFVTRVLSQFSVWLICTAIAFGVIYWAAVFSGRLVKAGPRFKQLIAAPALLVAGAASLRMASSWMVFRLAIVQSPVGATDPLFGVDLGFFLFTLPALELLNKWFNGLLVLAALFCFAIITTANKDDISGGLRAIVWDLKALTMRLGGLLMLSVAFNYWIGAWRLTYTSRATLVGASYADVHAQLPAYRVMVVLSIALAVVLFVTASSRKWKLPVATFATWAVAGIVLVSWWPSIVQTYVVAPNEARLEAPYIKSNIEMTRMAFDLGSVQTAEYSALAEVPAERAIQAQTTLGSSRVWTPAAVEPAYAQLQTIRPYYRLSPIDTDRYAVNGVLEQVLVSGREIDTAGLPKKARTWVNEHLVYTHGYGLVIASASRTTPQGFPKVLVGDVPPQVADDVAQGSPALVTQEPRIYFGPRTTQYAIVHTGIDEFDYPAGDTNATCRHDGSGGIGIGGLLGKVLWAVRLGSTEVLFSDYIEPDSQVLLYRDVMTRARKIAPWLIYDEKPYAALVDGRIVWIFDAYTASDHVPYSQQLDDGTNYLRDSVKVTVDAYSGETTFWANGADPIRDAWARIFPGVIVSADEVPPSLAAHFRYPEKLFSAQADIYRTYHMADPMVFYNKEDQWTRVGGESDPAEPSYLLLDPPGSDAGVGMYLMQPYTPPGRDNLLGIMTAACEPAEYGQQTVYAMPKDRVVLGPQQVTARINQDPEISPQLSLWNQRGSAVVFGDMLTMPVEGSVAYVQPIFLQAEKSAMTELVSVVLVSGDRVAMAGDLPGVLRESLGAQTAAAAPSLADTEVGKVLERAADAKRRGSAQDYADALAELRSLLDPHASAEPTAPQ